METFNAELNIQAVLGVTSREQTVEIDLTKLSDEILAQAIIHGLTQKIADAAAGAKKLSEAEDETRSVDEITYDLMSKVVTQLTNGDWGRTRGAASGLPAWWNEARAAVRDTVKKLDAAKYKAATQAERDAMVDAHLEGLDEAKRATVEKVAKSRLEMKKQMAALKV
jgi:hypothetical protein